MNFIKVKKATSNEGFKSVAQYTSHVDAFQKINLREQVEAKENRKKTYAKLLAQKRANETDRTMTTVCADQSEFMNTSTTIDMKELIAEKRRALRDFQSFCKSHRIHK
jgi:hypothetical protein